MNDIEVDMTVQELLKLLGPKKFYRVDDLLRVGVFANKTSAMSALRKRQIAHLKISPFYRLIPVWGIERYLRERYMTVVEND